MSQAHLIVARRRLRNQRHTTGGRRILLLIAVAVLALSVVTVVAGAVATFGTYQYYSRDYVPIEELLVDRQSGITRVYDRTGEVEIGNLSNPEAPLLDPVELDGVAPVLIDATLATEDKGFWDHPGLNFRGVARAAWENYVGGGIGSGSGGSSITQQLVKNVYICGNFNQEDDPCVAERTIDRKLREMTYALKLEQDYSKEQILNWYLNQISYGDRYVGVQAASRGYFRTDASQLSIAQAAMLAGIPAAPTTYHPRINCERDANDQCILDDEGRVTVTGPTRDRQRTVLNLMVENQYITPQQAAEAANEPLLVYAFDSSGENNASAFVNSQVEPRLVRMCEAGILPHPEDTDCAAAVGSAGWRVTTTLDWEKTQAAQSMIQQAIAAGIEDGCECHNAAIVTIDPNNGQLVVYAPNSDPSNTEDPQVAGNIDQLVEINQPGSSLKPAIYLAWFEFLNRTPMSVLWDTSPLVLEPGEDAVPERVEIVNPRPGGGGEGLITARAALGGSQNVPAFRAAQEAGLNNVIQMAKWLGITTLEQSFDPTFVSHESVIYGPTIATGGANITAVDMAVMNATIANMGVMVGLPHHATYVEDLSTLKNTAYDEGADYELALDQKSKFQHGHLRLPGTRELDPVAILEVRDSRGTLIYSAPEPERQQVVDPGTTWLIHSIMSDCTARFIIWSCGSSNEDLRLDVFLDGEKVPMGVKTGTQQGPLDADDTLETWMNGYTRHAATAVWVGNATNELVQDGAGAGFAASHATLWLFKDWMATYHQSLLDEGSIAAIAGFEEVQPDNVTEASFLTPTTERGRPGGCSQRLQSWQRTDIDYEPQCEGSRVILPEFKRDAAIDLARSRGIRTEATQPRRSAPSSSSGSSSSGSSSGGSSSNGGGSNSAPPPTPTPTQAAPAPTPTQAPPPPTPTPVPDDGGGSEGGDSGGDQGNGNSGGDSGGNQGNGNSGGDSGRNGGSGGGASSQEQSAPATPTPEATTEAAPEPTSTVSSAEPDGEATSAPDNEGGGGDGGD